mmetsp:Transcript_111269/g.248464  ORF Transcript_111269/g.248464 Transcript_111269/m.248464 type:complete len:201 (-) Transcript_111269:75-677(-)
MHLGRVIVHGILLPPRTFMKLRVDNHLGHLFLVKIIVGPFPSFFQLLRRFSHVWPINGYATRPRYGRAVFRTPASNHLYIVRVWNPVVLLALLSEEVLIFGPIFLALLDDLLGWVLNVTSDPFVKGILLTKRAKFGEERPENHASRGLVPDVTHKDGLVWLRAADLVNRHLFPKASCNGPVHDVRVVMQIMPFVQRVMNT